MEIRELLNLDFPADIIDMWENAGLSKLSAYNVNFNFVIYRSVIICRTI